MLKFILPLIAVSLLAACQKAEEADGSGIVLGGDRDEHGCIPSAGYSWDAEKQKCVRPWEE